MHHQHFQRGDQVRLRQPIMWVARGTCGTIIVEYLWARDWYDVQFAPGGRIRPVYAADLELLTPSSAPTPGADIGTTTREQS